MCAHGAQHAPCWCQVVWVSPAALPSIPNLPSSPKHGNLDLNLTASAHSSMLRSMLAGVLRGFDHGLICIFHACRSDGRAAKSQEPEETAEVSGCAHAQSCSPAYCVCLPLCVYAWMHAACGRCRIRATLCCSSSDPQLHCCSAPAAHITIVASVLYPSLSLIQPRTSVATLSSCAGATLDS